VGSTLFFVDSILRGIVRLERDWGGMNGIDSSLQMRRGRVLRI
jgi:hypothetical protein